jgi:hypothetical protein
VVIDLANSSSFEDKAVLEFFESSDGNLLAVETAAGVRHHVAPSIIGTDRTPDNGYFRAKVAQEKLLEASGVPYTIPVSGIGTVAATSADGNLIRLSHGLLHVHHLGPRRGKDEMSLLCTLLLSNFRSLSKVFVNIFALHFAGAFNPPSLQES